MPKRRPTSKSAAKSSAKSSDEAVQQSPRIIGGTLRGSKLQYEALTQRGAKVTRPMKHRVREAIFNLVGLRAKGKHAVDLFAGTGALGLEALSRGASRATFIERHLPTAAIVRQNIASLGVEDQCNLLTTSAFLWVNRDLPTFDRSLPWLVFISPPYDFFVEQEEALLAMINTLLDTAPPESLLVVEADERFDFDRLPHGVRSERYSPGWDVRAYAPAVVGVLDQSDLV